jgi:phosphocarrier protein
MNDDADIETWAARDEVIIDHPTGLHARPAISFTKLAKTFSTTDVRIRGGDAAPWIDAKSIVKVMGAKLKSGSMLELRARGDDAEAAIKALKDLVERRFDEDVDG